ncbi:MAG: nodulation protein NfeD [Deferribacteraceae bacterium]|jgi:membrane-bound serine protease (ClpP class)|nr:nodulation protein NfeD [Deferribacteraceae bacterium]
MKKLFLLILILLSQNLFAKNVYFLEIKGVITPFTVKYIKGAIQKAENDSGFLVLKIDTPGGVLDSTRKIVQNIFESKAKIISFVSPQGARAGSAGTFIVLASDMAVMAEGTNIGAAHPVSVTGKDIEGEIGKKIENDTVAFMKSIAEKRGRNVQAATQTVLNSKSFTSSEALQSKLIDLIVNSDSELLNKIEEKYQEKNLSPVYIKPDIYEKISIFLSDPNVLMLLLIIAILSIFLEIKMPGTFVFAGIGISALLLFLFGINIIPLNYMALLLILAGIALLIMEIFIPSFGLLTFASVVSLVFGMKLLFDKEGNMGIGVSSMMIAVVVSIILLIALIIGRLVLKDFKKKPETGMEKLINMTGTVKVWNDKKGKVFLNGEFWDAVSEDTLSVGDTVQVTNYKDMTLYVKKC